MSNRARERALFRYRSALERGDFDTVIVVLKLAERDSALLQMIEEMAELDEAPIARPDRRYTTLLSKSKGIIEIIIRRDPSPDGWPHIPDAGEEESDIFTTYAPTRTLPDARKLRWDPITLAVAVLVVVVLGMVLLFMRAAFNPGAGGAGAEALPEFAAQPGVCDLSMDHLLVGNSALESGDYEAALAAYNCAVEADTNNYDARLGRSVAHVLLGQYVHLIPDWGTIAFQNSQVWNEAFDQYSSALEADPNNLLLLTKRSYVLWSTQARHRRTIEDFDHILQLDPDNVYALLFRGTVYLLLREEEAAIADFERAISLEPDNPHIYAISGHFYGRTHREWGMEQLNHAITLDSNTADFYVWRGMLHEWLSENEEAVSDYSQAIELAPDDSFYYYWRGLLYRDAFTDFDEAALADFTHAIELESERPYYYFVRAETYEQLPDSVAATNDLRQYIERTEVETITQEIEFGERVILPMAVGRVYRITIPARDDQRLTITATPTAGFSIPLYVILDRENAALFGSPTLGVRNYEIPRDGTYTILVTLPPNTPENEVAFVVELDG